MRLTHALRWALASRDEARQAVAHLLDLQFAAVSPIPEASGRLLDQLGQYPVWLPPARLLQAGNQRREGLQYLVALGHAIAAGTVFEIGTYNGVTAWTLARNLSKAMIHTLDLPADTTPALELGPSDAGNIIPFARRAYEDTPEAERVEQHFADSATFDYSPLGGSCDLVYVDGAHSRDYVRNDTELAFELVTDSGVVVWDDYWRRLPHVAEYLNSIDRPLVRLPGSRLVAWIGAEHLSRLTEERGRAVPTKPSSPTASSRAEASGRAGRRAW